MSEILKSVLGNRLVAYYEGDDELMLKFEDGTILQWQGYRSMPLDADRAGLREIWEEQSDGNWKE